MMLNFLMSQLCIFIIWPGKTLQKDNDFFFFYYLTLALAQLKFWIALLSSMQSYSMRHFFFVATAFHCQRAAFAIIFFNTYVLETYISSVIKLHILSEFKEK